LFFIGNHCKISKVIFSKKKGFFTKNTVKSPKKVNTVLKKENTELFYLIVYGIIFYRVVLVFNKKMMQMKGGVF